MTVMQMEFDGSCFYIHIVPDESEDQFMRLVRKRFAERIALDTMEAFGSDSVIERVVVTVEGLEEEEHWERENGGVE